MDRPTAAGRPSHLSAASGLVLVQSRLYVVADDEHHLGVFPAEGEAPGRLIRIQDGELPDDKVERKRRKPDLEALLLLPPFARHEYGALLAIGSGSTPNRERAVLLALNAKGWAHGERRAIDLSPMFAPMREQVGELNIEGAVILTDRLILFQRGNKGGAINAVISTPLSPVLEALAAGTTPRATRFDMRRCDLGAVNGIPFSFTDAAALPDGRIVFSAVAEDTASSYLDGACAGAAVGVIDADGQLERMEHLRPRAKVEGIDARPEGSGIRLLLVTDADDPQVPASLYRAEMPFR